MYFLRALLLILLCLLPVALRAETTEDPSLISLGGGEANFDHHSFAKRYYHWQYTNIQTTDLRFEYRSGISLLPLIDQSFRGTERYFTLHPMLGLETNLKGTVYGLGGIATDIYLGSHALITWSEGAGLYYPGGGFSLGSVLEFRSMVEAGWRFDNNMRLSAFVSHTSNGKITYRNPGSETVGLYLHLPVRFFGDH